jgi:hypothetical protein
MWKGLFWRWKAVQLEMRLVVGKSGAMSRVMTMLMGVLAKNLSQTIQKQVRAQILYSASHLLIVMLIVILSLSLFIAEPTPSSPFSNPSSTFIPEAQAPPTLTTNV